MKSPIEKLWTDFYVDETGGPYCRHLDSEEQMMAYDATCRKLFKFLQGRNADGFSC